MGLRVLAGLLWLGLVVEAFGFAPAATPGTGAMIWKMLTLQTQGVEPWVFAIFNSLGIVPMVYACLLLPEPKRQKVAAWPFVGLSFFLGAFGLFPYLVLRHPPASQESGNTARTHSFWQRLSESKILAGFLLAGGLMLMGYGLLRGNVQAFAQAWKMPGFCCACVGMSLAYSTGLETTWRFPQRTLAAHLGSCGGWDHLPPATTLHSCTRIGSCHG